MQVPQTVIHLSKLLPIIFLLFSYLNNPLIFSATITFFPHTYPVVTPQLRRDGSGNGVGLKWFWLPILPPIFKLSSYWKGITLFFFIHNFHCSEEGKLASWFSYKVEIQGYFFHPVTLANPQSQRKKFNQCNFNVAIKFKFRETYM